MSGKHPGRRIRNFLLDSKLQLHYVAQMVGVSAFLMAGLGLFMYRFSAEAARVVEISAVDDQTAKLFHEQQAAGQAKLVIALVVTGALICLALALWQIVTTHKIAGPLYYMKREMKKLKEGRVGTLHKLRRGDMLHDFFDVFADLHSSLRDRNAKEAALFAQLAGDADKGGLPQVAEQLRTLARERQDSIK